MDIAIVDDVEQDRLHMEQLVLNWSELHREEVHLSLFDSGETFLEHLRPGLFSVILLDIFMTGIDGMETAREMRRRGYTCQIVFTTSSDAYALQGYEVDAANYLLKPVDAPALNQALQHCLSRLGSDRAAITVISNRSTISIPLRRIVWIEAHRNALLFYTDGGPVKSYMTLENLSKTLDGYGQFLLCFKGILVNMDRISSVDEYNFVMDNGDYVPIRKRGASQVKQEYMHYLFSHGQS